MEADAQGGHDAEVAAAAQRPEQVGLRVRAGGHAPPVRRHHFGAKQVVRSEAAGAAERAVAAAQAQAGHADPGIVAFLSVAAHDCRSSVSACSESRMGGRT